MIRSRIATKLLCFIVLLIFITQNQHCYAQEQDSIENPELLREDLARKRKAKKEARRKKFLSTLPKNHNPKTASLLGLIPGGGQIYNRRYWKLPIVYGGLGALGYFAVDNYIKYGCYRQAYLYEVDDDLTTSGNCALDPDADASTLKILRDNSRETADFMILGFVVFYGLTIVDAFVDAHLMHFDIDDDLSMEIRPNVGYDYVSNSVVPSVGLRIYPRIKAPTAFPVQFN